MHKKILAVDFDGVLHSYSSGWKGATNVPDTPVFGAIEWLDEFIITHCTVPDEFCAMAPKGEWELHIFSSRSRYWGGRKAMKQWLLKHGFEPRLMSAIKWPLFKPAATVQLDDRAITFTGEFPSFSEILNFQPWNKRKNHVSV
jgi:hypothetical protein